MVVSSFRNAIATDRPAGTPLEGIVVGVLLSTLLWAVIGFGLKWVFGR